MLRRSFRKRKATDFVSKLMGKNEKGLSFDSIPAQQKFLEL